MLHFLLKWKSYRSFKNGFLLDFIIKRVFHKISIYFFYVFTIFFGDKFILEQFFSNFTIFLNVFGVKLRNISKSSFITFFKLTLYIVFYIILVIIILFYI